MLATVMLDFTTRAVIRQLGAMNCDAFRVGIFNRAEKRMINKDILSYDEIINMVSWLKYQNAEGRDIYITQANGIDRALLLVDDLTRQRIGEMNLRGVAPACVIETSPRNFQARVSLGPEPMSKPERKLAARILAREFKGDLASADANHYGRLAGFTNRKESHLTSSGYPYVKCWEADGKDAERSLALREWAKAKSLAASSENVERYTAAAFGPRRNPRNDPAVAFALYFAEWVQRVKTEGKTMDISRGDFAVTCRMLKEGYSKKQIASAFT